MRAGVLLLMLTMALAGCGGQYVFTVPDAVGPAGGQAPVTIRLQREEFWLYYPPVKRAAVTARLHPTPLRAAYTDSAGYASAAMPLPPKGGLYSLAVHHMNNEGDEADYTGRCYALEPQRLAVAVDWDAIEGPARAAAAEALSRIAQAGVSVVYLSTAGAAKSEMQHRRLLMDGFPDGPILSWGWAEAFDRNDPVRLRGSLPAARGHLPNLAVAVTDSVQSLPGLGKLGITPVLLGTKAVPARYQRFVRPPVVVIDWNDAAERILAAAGLMGVKDFTLINEDQVRAALGQQAE